MYCGVPAVIENLGLERLRRRARPKSISTGRPVAHSMTMLLGFTSRWMSFRSWTAPRPLAMAFRSSMPCDSSTVSPASIAASRLRPSTNSIAK